MVSDPTAQYGDTSFAGLGGVVPGVDSWGLVSGPSHEGLAVPDDGGFGVTLADPMPAGSPASGAPASGGGQPIGSGLEVNPLYPEDADYGGAGVRPVASGAGLTAAPDLAAAMASASGTLGACLRRWWWLILVGVLIGWLARSAGRR